MLNLKEGPKVGGWETGKAGPAKQTIYVQGPRGQSGPGAKAAAGVRWLRWEQ